VREGTLWSHINLDEIRAAKTKGPDCARCAHEPSCDGVWRDYVERRGWSEFRPVAPGPGARSFYGLPPGVDGYRWPT
jgi:hypothetical protein